MTRPTVWETGRQPGQEVVTLGIAVILTVAALDLLVSDRLGWFFNLGFVALCVFVALRVRPGDFFTIGVLPPLLLLSVTCLIALARPTALSAGDGLIGAIGTGLADHVGALLIGHVLCLAALAFRRHFVAVRQGRTAQTDPSRRPVSPRNEQDLRLPV